MHRGHPARLDAACEAGGETVVIPCGEYVTGTINLRTASLCLEKGAILRGSPDYADSRFIGYDHNEMGRVHSLIYAMDSDD